MVVEIAKGVSRHPKAGYNGHMIRINNDLQFSTATGKIVLSLTALLALFLLSPSMLAPSSAQAQSSEPVGPTSEIIPLSSLGERAVGLTTQKVEKQSLPKLIQTPGKIEVIPTHVYVQHAPLSGRISRVLANLGDTVTTGQVLIILESPELNRLAADLMQSKQQLEADLAIAQVETDNQVKENKSRLALAQTTYNRDKKLFDERIGSQKDVQAAQMELEVAQTKLQTSIKNRDITLQSLHSKIKTVLEPITRQLKLLGVTEQEISEMLSRQNSIMEVPVRSQKPGVIIDIDANIGEGINTSSPLFTIADLSTVWATANIYEEDMSRVAERQEVSISVGAFPDEKFIGKVSHVGMQVDPNTRTLPVRIEIKNPSWKLKPDMFARLSIETNEPASSILVSKDAVIERNGHSMVFVKVKGGYQPTQVNLGRTFGDQVEILNGLSPGQIIVTRGAFQLAAELLKSHGGADLFTHPVEGERIGFEHHMEAPAKPGLGLAGGIIGILVAFILGISVGIIFFVRRQKQLSVNKEESQYYVKSPD